MTLEWFVGVFCALGNTTTPFWPSWETFTHRSTGRQTATTQHKSKTSYHNINVLLRLGMYSNGS